MSDYVGTARVGPIPETVLGPLDRDVLLQNQSPQKMLIWLDENVEEPPIELLPYRQTLAPFGSLAVVAQAPMARQGQTYKLFYSQVVETTITQG